jgi:ATP-dependent Clp protease, protease subunit
MQSNLPATVYAAFSGQINQDAAAKIFNSFGGASQRGVTTIHLLFQSSGGNIGDGICIYNFFQGIPLELHIYNCGTVASIGVLAFLGARYRYTSAHATFGIHKSRFPTQTPADAIIHRALADQLLVEDARTEAIIKARTNIPADRWALHAQHDVTFDAQEAVQFGIADAIREFQIPAGNQVFHI